MDFIRGSIATLTEIVQLNYKIFGGMYEREPYTFKEYLSRLSGKNPLIYLCLENGRLIGDSIAFEQEGDYYLWILGVQKVYRRRGIASKFLKLNEEFAKRNGFRKIRTKVYGVSKEMIELLTKRGYFVYKKERSVNGPNSDVYYFSLDLKMSP